VRRLGRGLTLQDDTLVDSTTGDAITDEVTAERPAMDHTHNPADVIGTAVITSDSRLSNARTPIAHVHAAADVTGTAVLTADARLSDARTPTTHTHPATQVTGLAGVIVLWHGTDGAIPTGWQLADGTNGTADLSASTVAGKKYIEKLADA
jgi:hypothetical protein